jgi:CBS domain-containing protein
VLADLVARSLLHDSIMTEKLSRRGIRVPDAYQADILRTTTVGAVMTRDVVTLPAGAPVDDAVVRFQAGGHGAYPLVDDKGRLVGIVTRGDLLAMPTAPADDNGEGEATLGDVFGREVTTVTPSEQVIGALHLMLDEEVEHLPVVDEDGRLVGICTRTDVLKARRLQRHAELRQPGWLGHVRVNGSAAAARAVSRGLGPDPGSG